VAVNVTITEVFSKWGAEAFIIFRIIEGMSVRKAAHTRLILFRR
jgi:hypothetical protein